MMARDKKANKPNTGSRDLIKRYISVDDVPVGDGGNGGQEQRGLPFYDTVRKNVSLFDIGSLRSQINKLRAIGFESWRGVTSGCVAAFKNKFEAGCPNRKIAASGLTPAADDGPNVDRPSYGTTASDPGAGAGEDQCGLVLPGGAGDTAVSVTSVKEDTDADPPCDDENEGRTFRDYSSNYFTSTLHTVLQYYFKSKNDRRTAQGKKTRDKNGVQRSTSLDAAPLSPPPRPPPPPPETSAAPLPDECPRPPPPRPPRAAGRAPPVVVEFVGQLPTRCGQQQSICANGKVAVGIDLVLLPPGPLHGAQLLRWKAESKKEEGNSAYKRKAYREAIELYTEAIDLCPTYAAYYGNRAACYMMTGNYSAALEDSRQAVKFDDSFVKGYVRESKCHLALGDAAAAHRSLAAVQALEPSNNIQSEIENIKSFQLSEADAKKHYDKNDYRSALYHLDRALAHAVACTKIKLWKAECLVFLGRHQEAQDIAYDIMRADSTNADAIYVRGLSLYYMDMVDKAFNHFQQVLRFAPDHSRAAEIYRRAKNLKQKKEEGNEAFRSGRLQEAYDLYSQALLIDLNNVFTNAKLYFNRALVSAKLSKHSHAVEDCSMAIQLDENYVKAYLKRAKCFMDLEMYEEAVRDYEKICKLEKTREHKQLLQEAKLELKKSKRKDYYKILAIGRNATEDEIKKAYRKRAMEHHPDRHANATADIKKEQEKKFKELGEAYSILSDPKKKSRYDCGQDLEEMDGGCEFDPYNLFQTFYAAPNQFQFSSGGGRSGFPGGSGGGGGAAGFPGGFSFKFA